MKQNEICASGPISRILSSRRRAIAAESRDAASTRRRSFLWAAGRPTAHCGLPEGLAERQSAPRLAGRAGPPLLFGLAPRGVYRAANIAARAVGSYPTVSPLPSDAKEKIRQRFGLGRTIGLHAPAVYFLWHCP